MTVPKGHPLRSGPTTEFDVVAVAASAGGLNVLIELVRGLPADFSAAMLLVQHRGAACPGMLEEILASRGRLPVLSAADGQVPQAGRIYLPPAGFHLAVRSDGTLDIDHRGPSRSVCPSADLLFE